ncbi:hypothetical protein DYD21_04305 [Rhodohalobacter sp. SW132]|uniref:TraR/DksA family transcriptional regulator n=1 Tax=Rhodohalobacter sp. SW132 TaxID=2293433 RepID=UPI000E2758CD|nr:TraR/DksA C4-type zinc finger protein [Rhodohalobacter sp. SW132]REL39184.1 hypothetical protein DYD21_04305 [Rhodohalobacter sp. SW132]
MSESKEKYRTHLSDEELDHFKKKLKEEKSKTEDEIENLKSSAESIQSDADDVQSGVDHHPGDVASDHQNKKTTLTLLEKQREKLKLIESAFERIESGTYGICTVTGKPIQKERLEVMPYAMHSVDAKS